jgi:alkylation response protein AidB-like acyl-CoA dehydrogenase
MNLDDSAEDAAFRGQIRQWLAANAPRYAPAGNLANALDPLSVRRWQAAKAEGGYAAFTWPKEFGGRGETLYQLLLFTDEERKFDLPADLPHGGIDLVMTSLMQFGRPEQYERFLEPTRRGDVIWSMLFSEPSAGSDVSAARLKAERLGDDWILNGQKTWTSWSVHSDWAMTIARTNPTLPKHKGLSCFIIDMRTPGLDVRPIRFLEGESHGFDEVFFTDVRVPHSQMIGNEGDGWKIFLTTLAVDRFTASSHLEISGSNFWPIFRLAQRAAGASSARISERDVRQRLADYYVDVLGTDNLRARHLTMLSRSKELGPETAIGKLILSNRLQEMAAFAMDLMGPAGAASSVSGQTELASIQEHYFTSASYRIGAGTDEIIRNSIAERVLGLPPEHRTDKDVPFNQLRVGA